MPDQGQSTEAPVCWTDDGIYRAAFLALFEPAHRAVLRQAGDIIATQAIAGSEGIEPVVDDLRAAAEDARMTSRYLQQIAEMRRGHDEPTDREIDLCRLAEHWQRNAADLAHEIEGEVEEASDEPAGALGQDEVAAAARLLAKMRAVLEEAQNLQRLDRDGVIGRSVGNLAAGLAALEAAIKGDPE
jgi:hypothetical protein